MPNDLRHVVAGDDAQPIVLVHGFGADRFAWLANQAALGAAGAVYALDLPGHGQEPLSERCLGDVAENIAQRLDNVALRNCALVGHSLGGAVSLLLAAARPDLVRALVLIAPVGLGQGVDPDFLCGLPELREQDEAERLLRRLVSRPGLIGKPMVAGLLRHLLAGDRREALRRVATMLSGDAMAARAAAERLAASELPRLVIWGAEDGINRPDEEMLSRFGGRLEICPGAGHLPQVESAARVNALMLAFLAASDIGPAH